MNVDFNHKTWIYSELSDTLILIATERRKAIHYCESESEALELVKLFAVVKFSLKIFVSSH